MPRILKADLVAENKRLRQRLAEHQGGQTRSRSPKRKPPSSSSSALSAESTMRALTLVCNFERDPVIQEQKETIVKLQKRIEALSEGAGSVGDVLLAMWKRDCPFVVDADMIARYKKNTTPVIDVFNKIHKHADAIKDYCIFGTTIDGRMWA